MAATLKYSFYNADTLAGSPDYPVTGDDGAEVGAKMAALAESFSGIAFVAILQRGEAFNFYLGTIMSDNEAVLFFPEAVSVQFLELFVSLLIGSFGPFCLDLFNPPGLAAIEFTLRHTNRVLKLG